VKHGEEVVLHHPHDSLSDTAQIADRLPSKAVEGRIDRAKQEWARESDGFEPLPNDARPKRMQIQLDIGELWHDLETDG
jgi:hypothetical protein